VVSGTDQLPERMFEVLRQAQPVLAIQLQALQDIWQVCGDMPFLVFV